MADCSWDCLKDTFSSGQCLRHRYILTYDCSTMAALTRLLSLWLHNALHVSSDIKTLVFPTAYIQSSSLSSPPCIATKFLSKSCQQKLVCIYPKDRGSVHTVTLTTSGDTVRAGLATVVHTLQNFFTKLSCVRK